MKEIKRYSTLIAGTDRNGNLWSLISSSTGRAIDDILQCSDYIEIEFSNYFQSPIDYEEYDIILRIGYYVDILSPENKFDIEDVKKNYAHHKILGTNNYAEVPYFIEIYSKVPLSELKINYESKYLNRI